MNNIKVNSMVKVIANNGDVIIGRYEGIDYNGILLKNANINNNLKLPDAHVCFKDVKEVVNTI